MKKDLFQLSTHEFAAVLMGHSSKYHMSFRIVGDNEHEPDEVIGTYRQLMEFVSDHPELKKQVEDQCFDYDMEIDETDAIRYMRYRTDDFVPDLTYALLKDMDFERFMIFDEVECDLNDPEKYNQWKSTSTFCFYRAMHYLQLKVEEYKTQGILKSHPITRNGIPGCCVKEVDRLQYAASVDRSLCSTKPFDEDAMTFKLFCRKFSRGSTDRQAKEERIIEIVTTLDAVFKKSYEVGREDIALQAVRLFAILEAAFMSSPDLICIKDICIQLGLCAIIDKEEAEVIVEGLPTRSQLGLCPMTLEESALQKELGPSCDMREANICKQCKVKPCHYQYGQRRFILGKDDEYDKSLGEPRWAKWELQHALALEDMTEVAFAVEKDYTNINEKKQEIKNESIPNDIFHRPDYEVLGGADAFEELKYIYWYNNNFSLFLDSVLARMGLDGSSPIGILRESMRWDEDTIKRLKDDYELPNYTQELALPRLISKRVCKLKNDEVELDKYICSLMEPFTEETRYLFPVDDWGGTMVCHIGIKLLIDSPMESFDKTADAIQKASLQAKNNNKKGTGTESTFWEEICKCYYDARPEGCYLGLFKERQIVEETIHRFEWLAASIEGALLENGIKKDILFYQDFCGVRICDYLEASTIASCMEWTEKHAESYIQKYGHFSALNKEDDFGSLPSKISEPINVNFGDISLLPERFRTKKAAGIWEKAYSAGLIDENFKFKGTQEEKALFAGNLSMALFGKIDWIAMKTWDPYGYYPQKYSLNSDKPRAELSEKGKVIYDIFK